MHCMPALYFTKQYMRGCNNVQNNIDHTGPDLLIFGLTLFRCIEYSILKVGMTSSNLNCLNAGPGIK